MLTVFNILFFQVDYTVKVFSNCYVCFIGFTNDDVHLRRLSENGGTLVALNDIKTKRCTHIVSDLHKLFFVIQFLDYLPPRFSLAVELPKNMIACFKVAPNIDFFNFNHFIPRIDFNWLKIIPAIFLFNWRNFVSHANT